MKLNTIYTLLFFILLSCSEGRQSKQDVLREVGHEVDEQADSSEKKTARRKVKGDTLAVTPRELSSYLPEETEGYRVKEVQLDTASKDSPFSSAIKTYAGNSSSLKIALVDYNMSYMLLIGATTVYSVNAGIENADEKIRGITIGNVKGWEVYNHSEKTASVILVISDRFFLSIEADHQKDTELVKKIAEEIDLEELTENS